ncbi:MAG: hypothetical protein K8I27_07145, partial [Planctomycetes bacterium]|nr:hypothetical protein [Planctomycetota bacterium]
MRYGQTAGRLTGALLVLGVVLFAGSLPAQLTAIVPSGTDALAPGLPSYASGWPMSTWYYSQRCEAIYTVADLNAAGVTPGAMINSVSLRCAEVPGQAVANFRVRVGHTSNTAVTTYTTSANLTQVFGPQTFQTTAYSVGNWNIYTFSTPFMWNGTQNLVLDFSTTGTSYTSGGGCYVRTAGTNRCRYGYQDSGSAFPHDTITSQGNSNMVPTIQLNYAPGTVIISTPSPLPEGIDGFTYNQTIQAVSGTGTLSWTVGSGLPPGVVASTLGNDLILSGTPTTTGTYQFLVTVQDSSTPPDSHQKLFTIDIKAPNLEALESDEPPTVTPVRFYSGDAATSAPWRNFGQVNTGTNKDIRVTLKNNSTSSINW